MTHKHFVSIESRHSSLTNLLLPGGENYGFESVMGMSENLKYDVEAINLATLIAECLIGYEVDSKFNVKFFPDLPSEFTFGDPLVDSFDSQAEFIENSYMIKRMNVMIDDEQEAQIAACIQPPENQFMELLGGNDHHFTKQTVSSKVVLN